RDTDRVLATILFTDIVDSTVRAANLGDHRWQELLSQHHRIVRREIERMRGREMNTTGDGFVATFEGPARAIRCALAAAAAVQRIGLQIRAGIHTGECELHEGSLAGIRLPRRALRSPLALASQLL